MDLFFSFLAVEVMSSYLQAVYATIDRAPTKNGKKRRKMKMVCIWAALPDRRGGWQLCVRLTWEMQKTNLYYPINTHP